MISLSRGNDKVYVKAQCFRSFKKNDNPHKVLATLQISSPKILDANCGCVAGVKGTCNHAISLLRLLTVLTSKGIYDQPNELSCTDKPQKWNRPRGEKIAPFSVIDLNTQAPREGGSEKPIYCRMYDSTSDVRDETKVALAVKELITNLSSDGKKDGWASLLPNPESATWVETKMGYAPKGSFLSLQLSLNESGFEVIHNLQRYQRDRQVVTVNRFPIPNLSDNCKSLPWATTGLPKSYDPTVLQILQKNAVSFKGARLLEENTRGQADCILWKEARSTRLNSSAHGLVIKRRDQKWTVAGVKNIVSPKDIGHLHAIKYGKKFESVAKRKYEEQMKILGHNITVFHSGYIVDPSQPWLGTSPDGLVFDPKEPLPYGALEIKSPWSLRGETPSTIFNNGEFHVKNKNGEPSLSDTHNHYFQILSQMGLSGLSWCDYVTFLPAGLIIVRVHFDEKRWSQVCSILKNFYFTHMLPHLVQSLP